MPRLDELEEDLFARRKRAAEEDWGGENEGLYLTLTFLRSKREQVRRFQRGRVAVNDVYAGEGRLGLG